jgi:hypothetical protein
MRKHIRAGVGKQKLRAVGRRIGSISKAIIVIPQARYRSETPEATVRGIG